MRVFTLIAVLTALSACDGSGPAIQKGEGPATQTADLDGTPGLPVGVDANQPDTQAVQSENSPR